MVFFARSDCNANVVNFESTVRLRMYVRLCATWEPRDRNKKINKKGAKKWIITPPLLPVTGTSPPPRRRYRCHRRNHGYPMSNDDGINPFWKRQKLRQRLRLHNHRFRLTNRLEPGETWNGDTISSGFRRYFFAKYFLENQFKGCEKMLVWHESHKLVNVRIRHRSVSVSNRYKHDRFFFTSLWYILCKTRRSYPFLLSTCYRPL